MSFFTGANTTGPKVSEHTLDNILCEVHPKILPNIGSISRQAERNCFVSMAPLESAWNFEFISVKSDITMLFAV